MIALYDFYENLGIANVDTQVAIFILIFLLLMLGGGFLVSRITMLAKLPNATAYILFGVAIGMIFKYVVPSDFTIGPNKIPLPYQTVDGKNGFLSYFDFLSDIALSFMALGAGSFFKKSVLKEGKLKVIIITLAEAFAASLLVFLCCYFIPTNANIHGNVKMCLILAAIASSTASTSTIMTIKQLKAKGNFVNTSLQVVALDNALSLILFSIAIAIGGAGENGVGALEIILPLVYNIVLFALGGLMGFILNRIYKLVKRKHNQLVIMLIFILILDIVCALFNVSPLIPIMMMSMIYINCKGSNDTIYDVISMFQTPFMIIFFVYSGTKMDLFDLGAVGIIGIIYIFARLIGKYSGASLGAFASKSDTKVTKYLGLVLIPQAGVSIGLAALGSRVLINSGQVELANTLNAIILSSALIYEIIGPLASKLGLFLSKSYEIGTTKRKRQEVFSYTYTKDDAKLLENKSYKTNNPAYKNLYKSDKQE